MKIGIVTTWFERGAAYVSRQYMDVLKKKHEVFIYARGGEAYAKKDPKWDLPNVTWGKRNWQASTAVDLRDFKKWVTINQIEIVFFNEQKWWPVIQLCNELGIKNGAYIDYYKENTIPIYGLHDFLICNTKRHLSAFDWHQGATYIPWGTDTELFSPSSDKAQNNRPITFFHSAGMAPERKGTDLLLRAFLNTKNQKSRLVIHSQLNIRDMYPELKESMDSLVDQNRLEIIEETVSAPGLYYMGDIYVYPTRLEGIGLTIAEALSSGLAAIMPDWPPMNEFINRDCGMLVPVEKLYCRQDGYYWPMNEINTAELTKALDFCADNPSLVNEMKQKAREHALERLDWNRNASAIVECFEQAELINIEMKKEANKAAMLDHRNMQNWKSRLKSLFLYRWLKAIF